MLSEDVNLGVGIMKSNSWNMGIMCVKIVSFSSKPLLTSYNQSMMAD